MQNENLYDDLFKRYGQQYGIDWRLLKAQVKAESAFNPKAVSKCGAEGLAQVMPPTWKEYGTGSAFEPENAIAAQAKYMSVLLRLFKQNKDLALASYNWGAGNMKKLIRLYSSSTFEFLKKHMPAETQAYVMKINIYLKQYKEVKS